MEIDTAFPWTNDIDEAIQLAKMYSSEQAYAFINGILDAIARQRALPL